MVNKSRLTISICVSRLDAIMRYGGNALAAAADERLYYGTGDDRGRGRRGRR